MPPPGSRSPIGDLRTAQAILRDPDLPPRGAAEHAQQAAEKALKASILASDREPPRTHDLVALVREASDVAPLPDLSVDLDALTTALQAARYPMPADETL